MSTVQGVAAPIRLVCQRCGHTWLSVCGHAPLRCPDRACYTRAWNGNKLPSLVNQIVLPAPRKRGHPKAITPNDLMLQDDD